MISRIWHGWTTPENADVYERLLRDVIFVGIAAREIDGTGESTCCGGPLGKRWSS